MIKKLILKLEHENQFVDITITNNQIRIVGHNEVGSLNANFSMSTWEKAAPWLCLYLHAPDHYKEKYYRMLENALNTFSEIQTLIK